MSQSQIVGAINRPVPRILHGNGTLYVEQRLLTIRFSPAIRFSLAIRFYKPTSGVIVNNNKYWLSLNLYGIWILEHKGATTLQKLGGGEFRRSPNQGRDSEIRWPWPRWTPCSKKWGVGWPRWPRGSDATDLTETDIQTILFIDKDIK